MADDIDVEFEIPNETITSSDPTRFTCEVCGEPLTYSGRGRHPTRCEEHKTRGTASKREPTNTRQVAQIRTAMAQLYEGAGDGIKLIGQLANDDALVIDGTLIGSRADVLADEWAKLAATDPKVRATLMKITTGSAWGGVIITHAMLGFAIMSNHKAQPQRVKQPRPPRQHRRRAGGQPPNMQVVRDREPQPAGTNGATPPPVYVTTDDEPLFPTES